MPTKARPPADPAAFEEALRWFRERVPMTDDEYAALESEMRQRAFGVAGLAQLDLVNEVWQALDRAIADGTTLADFQRDVADKLTAAWGRSEPWRIENIFRTNVQTAYGAGRWEQMEAPAVKRARPYRKFSATMDSRTSPICRPLDQTVLPAGDAFWASHNPPLHFGCRSTVVTLTEDQADDAGVDDGPPRADPPLEGFGLAPDHAPEWRPDLTDYPSPLAEVARAAQRRAERSSR